MKRILTALLLYIFLGVSFAQNNSEWVPSLDLVYGQKIFRNNFIGQINRFDHYQFSMPIQYVGIGATGHPLTIGRGRAESQGYFSQIIPQKIKINDSTSATLAGNSFSLGLGRDLLRKSKVVDVFIFAGFNMGRLSLYGDASVKQKNFYFSPKLSLQPKVKIGPIAFSIRLDYEYDVSNPNWKKMYFYSAPTVIADKINQSGFTGYICLGYIRFDQ